MTTRNSGRFPQGEQVLKYVKYRQTLHNALAVVLGMGAVASFIGVIGYVNADGGWLGAFGCTALSLLLGFLAWLQDVERFYWETKEKEIMGKGGRS